MLKTRPGISGAITLMIAGFLMGLLSAVWPLINSEAKMQDLRYAQIQAKYIAQAGIKYAVATIEKPSPTTTFSFIDQTVNMQQPSESNTEEKLKTATAVYTVKKIFIQTGAAWAPVATHSNPLAGTNKYLIIVEGVYREKDKTGTPQDKARHEIRHIVSVTTTPL